MTGVVLAAGSGTRLRPVSLTRPKACVPVAGRTMIERVLDSLAAAGLTDFVLVVAAPDDAVARVASAWGERGGRRVRFAVQAERLGMGHALAQAAPLLAGPFLLSACDSLVRDDFVRALLAEHAARRANATLALQRVTDPARISQMGIVAWRDGWVERIVEKPRPEEAPSDMGSLPLYVFEPRLLEYLAHIQPSPRGELELQDAIDALIRGEGRVAGSETDQRWQITTVEDLLALNREFLDRGETRPDDRATCLGPVHIAPEARLGRDVIVGPHAVIEPGASLGDGCRVSRAVVLSDAEVPAGAVVEDRVVVPEV